MRKSWKWVPLTLALLLLAALWLRGGSERRAERFVRQYGAEIAESWRRDGAVPEVGQRYVNEWPGEHGMLEFILSAGPGGYSGCYYSPDGVPLAFQNTEIPLEETAPGRWAWQAQGDNHGETWHIEGNWFGFQASF